MVTPEREPLGITDVWMWSREAKTDGTRPSMRESLPWCEGYERVSEMARTMHAPDLYRLPTF